VREGGKGDERLLSLLSDGGDRMNPIRDIWTNVRTSFVCSGSMTWQLRRVLTLDTRPMVASPIVVDLTLRTTHIFLFLLIPIFS
jgi:hypothetical protein